MSSRDSGGGLVIVCVVSPPPLPPLPSFSEGGLLISYDTKGVVRVLTNSYQLSWQPVLNCSKVLGKNKGDHYYLVGMTHNPPELRCVHVPTSVCQHFQLSTHHKGDPVQGH